MKAARLRMLVFTGGLFFPEQTSFSESAAQSTSNWLLLGQCDLEEDPETSNAKPMQLCLSGKAGLETKGNINKEVPAAGLWHGLLYGGLHINDIFSLHMLSRYYHSYELLTAHDLVSYAYTEELALQVGNPSASRWRVAAGRLPIPFGIDMSPLPQMYRELTTRDYWLVPWDGAKLTFDNRTSLQIDIGVGSDLFPKPMPQKNMENPRHAMSARILYDFSALDGMRAAVSVYGEKTGERRISAGLINYSPRGEESHIEWVRRRSTPDNSDGADHRLFRFAYLSQVQNNVRYVGQYDDAPDEDRLGTFGVDYFLLPKMPLRFSISYLKSETDDVPSYWFGVAGIEANL